jgi:antitoxin component YwqK of YwqJK toxin-antitoxin module
MKKLSLFLLAVSMSLISFGQIKIMNGDTINKTDSKNLKQGNWEESVSGSNAKGTYKDNNKEGIWVTYNGKSIITKIESYKTGKKEGVSIITDENGYYKGEANYKNDILDGVQRSFATGGRLLNESYYTKGVLNGPKKSYYESTSKIQEEGNYINGERDGVTKWYNTDGKILAEFIYKNGKFEGINKTYYASGNIKSEEPYMNNVENGVYKEYFDTTLVANKAKTPDPTIKKTSGIIEDAGKLKITGNYANGKKEGKWLEYDVKGILVKTTIFKNGVEKK